MKSVDESQVFFVMWRSHCSKCSFETCRLSKIDCPSLCLMCFLVNIFKEINQRKTASTNICFYLLVFKKFSLSGATPRDIPPFPPINKKLTISSSFRRSNDLKWSKIYKLWAEEYPKNVQPIQWKIWGKVSDNGIFSYWNLTNSNANNILQYRVQKKYLIINYIRTCHRFHSFFLEKTEKQQQDI